MADLKPVETTEFINGFMGLIVKLTKHLKDGAQWHDIPDLLTDIYEDKTFYLTLTTAIKGIDQIPAELRALTAADGMDLAAVLIPWIKQIIAEFKSS